MKFRKLFLLCIVGLLSYFIFTLYTNFNNPLIHSKSAILINASTGDILFEKNARTAYSAASMSKLMTEYIVLDWIDQGFIQWNDEVIVSEAANDLEASAVTIPIQAGDSLTVQDLFKAMVISSANNATIALTEYIAGTEAEFVLLMNKKATELGLSDQTHFVNATGLPHLAMNGEENKMSAEDLAVLAYHLLKVHGDMVIETAQLRHYDLTAHGIGLVSTNKMLDINNKELYFEGMKGLKTGYTTAAGYCFIGTASRDDQQMISVIMGAESDELRFMETKKLLSYGFGEFHTPSLKEITGLFW